MRNFLVRKLIQTRENTSAEKFTGAERRALHELDFERQKTNNKNITEWHKPQTKRANLKGPEGIAVHIPEVREAKHAKQKVT